MLASGRGRHFLWEYLGHGLTTERAGNSGQLLWFQLNDAAFAGENSTVVVSFDSADASREGMPQRFSSYSDGNGPDSGFGTTHSRDSRQIRPEPDFEELAQLIRTFAPRAVGLSVMMNFLERTVNAASYWDEVPGEELVLQDPTIACALMPWAVVAAEELKHLGLLDAMDPDQQFHVVFEYPVGSGLRPAPPAPVDPEKELRRWRRQILKNEVKAQRKAPQDPRANFSGEWWSTPPHTLLVTSPAWPGSSTTAMPVGLSMVEDSIGWTKAVSFRKSNSTIRERFKIFTIDRPDDWAWLCQRYPLDVTASRRQVWYRTSRGLGPWLIPDFAAAGSDFDAIHLSLRGYLTTPGTAIAVHPELDEEPRISPDRSPGGLPHHADQIHGQNDQPRRLDADCRYGLLAGWAPMSTYWLRNAEVDPGSAQMWSISYGFGNGQWVEASTPSPEER